MKYRMFAALTVLSASAVAAEIPLSVPSDIRAQYFVLERSTKGNVRKITTKRVGPSGTTYSRRLINCSSQTAKYLGDGDSLEAMKASKPDVKMGPLIHGSIAFYIAEAACK